jgi:exodeoxyribonuclease VII large subunit
LNETDDPLENTGPRVFTVSELTLEIRDLLEKNFSFIWVEGEISNVRTPSSGHCYMALKDKNAQIRAVMFRPQARILKFRPEDGMKVIAQGRLGVYEPRGEYQLVLDYLEPLGMGALALAFEQLKEKLASQGLFRQELKRPLPFLPGRVAVITSPTGAAIRDFLSVIHRRFANIRVIVVPVRVQGDRAAGEIVEAIEKVNRHLEVDVIVVTRGGGSLEDLWPFNEEAVALAIRDSRIPVVSAVGHEIDHTISDLAADLRAPTPSAAAEMLVAEKESLSDRLNDIKVRLVMGARTRFVRSREKLDHLHARLKDPRKRIEHGWLRLDEISGRLKRAEKFNLKKMTGQVLSLDLALKRYSPGSRISLFSQRLGHAGSDLKSAMNKGIGTRRASLSIIKGKLDSLNPYSVLSRGYSITRRIPDGLVLRRAAEVTAGNRIRVTLSHGELECLVEEVDNK